MKKYKPKFFDTLFLFISPSCFRVKPTKRLWDICEYILK